MRRTDRLRLAVVLATALVLAACGTATTATTETTSAGPGAPTTTAGGDTTAPPGDGATVSMGMVEPAAIDPALAPDLYGFQVLHQLFEGLTDIDSDLTVIPGVAESWETDDNQTWTFHLRDDVSFSNGDPVTAETFVSSWARAAHPDTASPVAYHGLPIEGWGEVMDGAAEEVSGVTAVDETTLEVRTLEPFNLLPKVLAHPVFSPVPESALTDPDAFGEMPIGNGQYVMDGPWEHGQAIRLSRNPDYHGEPGLPEAIEFRLYSDMETAYRDVLAGNLDIAYQAVTPGLIANATEEFGDRLMQVPTGSVNYLNPPTAAPPFDDPDIRRALSMAIDREALTERIWQGTLTPATGLVPPQAPGAVLDGCPACTYDPDEARRLYDEAGGFPDGTTRLYLDSSGLFDDDAEFLANSWRQALGLETEIVTMEFAQLIDLLYEGWDDGIVMIGWIWDYPSAYAFLSPLLESTSGDNVTGWTSDDFDAALAAARTAEDEEAGLEHLEEAQRVFGDELPLIPLHFFTDLNVHSERVSDVIEDARGIVYLEQVRVEG